MIWWRVRRQQSVCGDFVDSRGSASSSLRKVLIEVGLCACIRKYECTCMYINVCAGTIIYGHCHTCFTKEPCFIWDDTLFYVLGKIYFHSRIIIKVWFSTFNYETGYQNRTSLALWVVSNVVLFFLKSLKKSKLIYLKS